MIQQPEKTKNRVELNNKERLAMSLEDMKLFVKQSKKKYGTKLTLIETRTLKKQLRLAKNRQYSSESRKRIKKSNDKLEQEVKDIKIKLSLVNESNCQFKQEILTNRIKIKELNQQLDYNKNFNKDLETLKKLFPNLPVVIFPPHPSFLSYPPSLFGN